MAAGGASSYAGAPALRVRTASGERLLERRHWEGGEGCPAGVCASLQDVAEGVLRLVHGPVSGDVSEAEPGEGAWPWRAVPSGRPPEGLGQDLGRALRGSHELVLAHRVVPSASEEVVADVAVLRARRQERVWVVVAVARPVVLDGLTRPLARVLGEGRVTRL